MGSIIADTGLIFGVCSMMMRLPANRFVLSRQGWIQFGSAALLGAVCYVAYFAQGDAATIGRGIGSIFLILLVLYMMLSARWSGGPVHVAEAQDHSKLSSTRLITTMLIALAGKRCYQSFQTSLNPNITRIRKDYVTYFDNILASGHGSVLEHSVYNFAIEKL